MIEINKLTVQYAKTDFPVFRDLSLSLKKGESIAILGPSGCGKTTLLNAIARIIDEKAIITGSIKIPRESLVRVVFQEPRLLPWMNVEDNIALALKAQNFFTKESKPQIVEMINIINLEKFKKYYPSKLSLGMKQRVNFARALICRPDIMLLDEPFSGLDSNNKNKIISEFKKIIKSEKITAILITHNRAEAEKFADSVIDFEGISKNGAW